MAAKTIKEKKINEAVKQELLNSLKDSDEVKEPGLDETANTL